LRRDQPALRSVDVQVEVLRGEEGDQGLRLRRGQPNTEGEDLVEVVINRSRRCSLAVSVPTAGKVLWPPQWMGAALPIRLEPQTAVVWACL